MRGPRVWSRTCNAQRLTPLRYCGLSAVLFVLTACSDDGGARESGDRVWKAQTDVIEHVQELDRVLDTGMRRRRERIEQDSR